MGYFASRIDQLAIGFIGQGLPLYLWAIDDLPDRLAQPFIRRLLARWRVCSLADCILDHWVCINLLRGFLVTPASSQRDAPLRSRGMTKSSTRVSGFNTPVSTLSSCLLFIHGTISRNDCPMSWPKIVTTLALSVAAVFVGYSISPETGNHFESIDLPISVPDHPHRLEVCLSCGGQRVSAACSADFGL